MSDEEKLAAGKRIARARKEAGLTQVAFAKKLNLPQSVISDWERGVLVSWRDMEPRVASVLHVPLGYIGNGAPSADLPILDPAQDYVSIEVLPTFAGMGGGGTGDADRETALVSRRLVADELRARPDDLLLINVRGNSMEPLFRHGDQLLIDRRDRSPTQPGPFALLYDDGYVVKNVAWVEKRSKLRVSSANPDFEPEDFEPEEVTIMGRPVWFARRL